MGSAVSISLLALQLGLSNTAESSSEEPNKYENHKNSWGKLKIYKEKHMKKVAPRKLDVIDTNTCTLLVARRLWNVSTSLVLFSFLVFPSGALWNILRQWTT